MTAKGRWPPHVIFSHNQECTREACLEGCPVLELDKQSGKRWNPKTYKRSVDGYGIGFGGTVGEPAGKESLNYGDYGGASRFYTTIYPGEEYLTDTERSDIMTETRLYLKDCLSVLREVPDNTLDSVVTDPPAGIGFMGKAWDSHRGGRDAWVSWLSERMTEVNRVLKPGAWGLVWALPKTSHWTALALEESGFIIEDRISHLFGSGFPKNKGTQLKPACEDWWLIRKERSERNVAANVERWGTGVINTDACRIGNETRTYKGGGASQLVYSESRAGMRDGRGKNLVYTANGRWPSHVVLSHNEDCEEVGVHRVKSAGDRGTATKAVGGILNHTNERRPTEGTGYADADGKELVTKWRCSEGCPVAELDRQSGVTTSVFSNTPQPIKTSKGMAGGAFGNPAARRPDGHETHPKYIRGGYEDTGGASRFFYVAKPSRKERDLGCDALPRQEMFRAGHGNKEEDDVTKRFRTEGRNVHPTVKSITLMRWLIRLVTPEGDTLIDPFMGSASTLCAAILEDRNSWGMETESEYFGIAEARVRYYAGTKGVKVRTFGNSVFRLPLIDGKTLNNTQEIPRNTSSTSYRLPLIALKKRIVLPVIRNVDSRKLK